MDNVAATITSVDINYPAPTVAGDCAALAPSPSGSAELSAHDLPVFHWKHDARFS